MTHSPSKKSLAIHWFRQDLRLYDNPALRSACTHHNVLPIYIVDDINAKVHAMGTAQRCWLYHSLVSLNASLDGCLSLYQGEPLDILTRLIEHYSITDIYWNRCYEPWRIQRDTQLKKTFTAQGIHVHTENASLLWEPWEISKNDGKSYQVFTYFYRQGCLQTQPPRSPQPSATPTNWQKDTLHSIPIEQLSLLPNTPWHRSIESHWKIGEKGAKQCLETFIDSGLHHYQQGRDFPSKPCVSRLSPYLHFGEISAHDLWHRICSIGDDENTNHFCRQLGWREFSYHQLYHHPDLPIKNRQRKFDAFAWEQNAHLLQAWQQGETGIPIVDAGMRELWQTGYMHNRVRMIVGSLLVKNLRIHWHEGERWFWDCLVDADLANNSAGWQWIAGCGADAAPYFRIFNPVTQGEKFDAEGTYTKHYVPELAKLPKPYLFKPWEAPESVLKQAHILLGKTYPRPIINLRQSRELALKAFRRLSATQ